MSVHADGAKNRFGENFRLFGNAQTQPEKFNLYGGLYNLTEAIEGIENELSALQGEIFKIKQALGNLR